MKTWNSIQTSPAAINMREINEVIVHASATPADMDIGFDEINRWHKRRGWDMCGYHRIIRRNGRVEWGRALATVGAHTKGRNQFSVGLCMVGGLTDDGLPDCNFTHAQFAALWNELLWLKFQFGPLKVSGHRAYAIKACPTFNATAFAEGLC